MSPDLDVSADLVIEVGERRMRLIGSGSRLLLITDRLPARGVVDVDAFADVLAASGIYVTVADEEGHRLAEAGTGVHSLVGRVVQGSFRVRPRLRLLRPRRPQTTRVV